MKRRGKDRPFTVRARRSENDPALVAILRERSVMIPGPRVIAAARAGQAS
jgi:hypothetical protein